jgi:hypothetical protein
VSEFSNLARIVHQRRLKGKRLLIDFDSPASPGSAIGKEQRLIDLVMAKPAATDLELTKELYTVATSANKAAFRQLRTRVQEKLLNNLQFLDYSDQLGLVSRPFELDCRTLLSRAAFLISEGENRLSMRLLQRCLHRAIEAEFTDLAEQAATTIATQYSEALDLKNYERVMLQVTILRQQLSLEQRADDVFNRFKLLFLTTGSGVVQRREFLPQAQGYINELELLHQQASSFKTFFNLYRARINYAEYTGSYEDVLSITQRAQQEYNVGKINPRRFDLRFSYFWIVYAHLRTKQLSVGLELAEEYASAFHPTSTNWFYYYEHYLLLALHSQRYELAGRILLQVLKNPSLPKIREAASERWELLYAYTTLVVPPGTITAPRRSNRIQLSELTVPEYSRDKSGYNVFILVYQVLQFLRDRKLEAVLSRLEGLRKYQQRYLKDSSLLRSRTFLRLLLLLPENEFMVSQITASERVNQQLSILHNAPFITEGSTEVEIIPYEHLWQFILHTLEQGPPV